ncbi:hypothetical protein DICPUDRAFT_38491 [Dictyostelium purpureum]|uniref:THIF-type NAD/FAD binding fold domain-containing protein n=1 Tax=Dictyostelium purpureum TaxID=5786 RepID=F0ZUL1_DICPU|nr:uncharacterized protein DICPUDRAFT_38491 [Dictyostelium purpureum]EGC32379.1 hypothetical protein DICPUDRAFT_38491 [Dictyostelium purpureum]|eukprot:XP_003291109.1 hypothetical protein DICPUDRAFT_38491 [Dictyostelium purpureum]
MENKLLIAGLGAGIGAAVTYLTSSLKKNKRSQDEFENSPSSQHNTKQIRMDTDDDFIKKEDNNLSAGNLLHNDLLREEIFNEQMDRTKLYYGDEAYEKIRNSFVVVVGLGGVGGAAAHVLCRSGIKKMRLIDPDLVTLSSLNRNALAQRKDVGRSKVETMKSYFYDICPEVEVEAVQTFFTGDLAEKLLAGNPDYVLDCIDNTQTKVELLTFCHRNNIKVISSFGAGSARDPTKIFISDISYTYGCPFGREIRRLLKVNGINSGINCCYTTEIQRKKLTPLTEEERQLLLEQAVRPTLRVRTLGVAMPIPFIFGTSIGCQVLNDFAGVDTVTNGEEKCMPPPLTEYSSQLKLLIKKECKLYNTPPTFLRKFISPLDVRYLIDEIFESKSAISQKHAPVMLLLRWRSDKPAAPNNLVYLSQKEGDIHETVKNVNEHYPKEVVERIDKLLSTVVMEPLHVELANSIL